MMRYCLIRYKCWTLGALMVVCSLPSACLMAQADQAEGTMKGKTPGEERTQNVLEMKFCWCPPGRFVMGSPEDEAGRRENEEQKAVKITRGFWIGKFEVTQDEWHRVKDSTPSRFKGSTLPVESVTWSDATDFVERLTKMERDAGRLPQDWEYRLPTEAQWEYAARGGKQTTYSFGDDAKLLGDYAWYGVNSKDTTHPVGEKKPNAWGLCDMHGNVWEWCRDWYQHRLPGGSDPEVIKGRYRVLRDGSWLLGAPSMRSACRFHYVPGFRGVIVGFRCALVQVGE